MVESELCDMMLAAACGFPVVIAAVNIPRRHRSTRDVSGVRRMRLYLSHGVAVAIVSGWRGVGGDYGLKLRLSICNDVAVEPHDLNKPWILQKHI